MPSEPRWLTADEIVELNRLAVTQTGEPFHVHRDLLEIAAARPENLWSYGGEQDTLALAIGLLFGLAQIHAFTQGNKRTAFAAADAFLIANGYILMIPDDDEIYDLVIAATTGAITEDEAVHFLERYIHPFD